MAHKVFISFKTEDKEYKQIIQDNLYQNYVDKSLNEPINSNDEDYIMRKIREDYLKDSTVTIALIGQYSAESLHPWVEDQSYIKRELQASLYNGTSNTKNGILAIILPDMYETIHPAPYTKKSEYDGKNVTITNMDDNTVIKEISANYYLDSPLHNSDIHYWKYSEEYVVLVEWDDFKNEPEKYIDKAFEKRTDPISQYTKVRPK